MKNLAFVLALAAALVFGYFFGAANQKTKVSQRAATTAWMPSPEHDAAKVAKLSQYRQVTCPLNSIQIAYFGQSNTINSIAQNADINIPDNLFQYDFKSGQCYRYQEPLLAVGGSGGNSISYYAVSLAQRADRPVLFIPFGVKGSSIIDWSYGYLSHLHHFVMDRLRSSGLSPNIFLWVQGESDAKPAWYSSESELEIKFSLYGYNEDYLPQEFMFGLNPLDYQNGLNRIVHKTFDFFPNADFGIALASHCAGQGPDENIRNAQRSVALSSDKTFIAFDSDAIFGNDLRYDNCHLSKNGAIEIAKELEKTVTPRLKIK